MSGWWVSWYSAPSRAFELHSPWWVSGWTADGHPIIVAAVRADDEAAAHALVESAYDDPADLLSWRFCESLATSPFSGRFPQADWMAWTDTATCACPTCSTNQEMETSTS